MAYLNQLKRIERFLCRIDRAPATDRPPAELLDEYTDDLLAFFENAWHLKDWIKHDSALAAHRINERVEAGNKKNIEHEVHNRTKWRHIWLCGEIANATKHLVRKEAELVGHYAIDVTDTEESAVLHSINYVVISGSTTIPALTVAKEAISEWKQLLTGYDLPVA